MVDISTVDTFMNDRLYLATIGNRMEFWDEVGLSLEDAGVDGPAIVALPAPALAVGVNTTPGTHLIKYRYVNDITGYLSNPSDQVEVIITDPVVDGKITFSVGTAGGDKIKDPVQADTSIQISMTTAAGSVFFIVDTLSSPFPSSVDIDISDAILITNLLDAPQGDFEYDVPPDGGIIVEHRGFMFMFRLNATNLVNTMAWSLPGGPESYNLNRRISVLDGDGDSPTAAIDHYGDLWIFGRHSLERYVFDSDPLFGERVATPTTDGLYNQRCFIKTDNGALYGLGPSGVWSVGGGVPKHLSKPVDQRLDTLINRNETDKIHGVFNNRFRYIIWFFPSGTDTQPKDAVAYSIDSGQWYLCKYRQAITTSRSIYADGENRTIVGDEFGKTWYLQGVADGINDADSVSTTALAGATTTVIPLAAAYTNIEGAMIKDVKQNEIRRVDSEAGGAVTVSPAFTLIPANGDAMIVGGIDWEVQIKHWPGRGVIEKKAPVYLNLEFVPSGTGTIRIQVFKDFETVPTAYSQSDSAAESTPKFVSIDLLTGDLIVDLNNDGFVSIPMPSDQARVWSAKLISEDSDGEPKLLDAKFSTSPHGKDVQQGE